MILMHLLILLPIQMSLVSVKNSKHLTFQARAISRYHRDLHGIQSKTSKFP